MQQYIDGPNVKQIDPPKLPGFFPLISLWASITKSGDHVRLAILLQSPRVVAIAIIGTLAGVAVPSVGKFINQGKTEAMETELDNVQVAVQVAMADAGVSEIANINEGAHKNLGDADHNPDTAGKDRKIAKVGSVKYFVGDYIAGDVDSLQGHYWLYRDGTVKTRWYPDLGIIN